MRRAGPVVGVVARAAFVGDVGGLEDRSDCRRSRGVGRARVVDDAMQFLRVGQPPVAVAGVGQVFRPLQSLPPIELPVAPPAGLDGLSFLPALLGQPQRGHDYLFWKYGEKTAVRKGHWKAVRLSSGKTVELYDLSKDIGEQTDVADEHPEVVAQMEAIMEEAAKPR